MKLRDLCEIVDGFKLPRGVKRKCLCFNGACFYIKKGVALSLPLKYGYKGREISNRGVFLCRKVSPGITLLLHTSPDQVQTATRNKAHLPKSDHISHRKRVPPELDKPAPCPTEASSQLIAT